MTGKAAAWSEETVAMGWEAEAEVRIARAEGDSKRHLAKAVDCEQRYAEMQAEVSTLRTSLAVAQGAAEHYEIRAMAAESRAANADAKLTSSEVAAAVAEAQVKLLRLQAAELQSRVIALEASNVELKQVASEATRRAESAEIMVMNAEEHNEAALRVANEAKAAAEERTRFIARREVADIVRAKASAEDAAKRAEVCMRSASAAIAELRRRDAEPRGSSPLRGGSPLRAGTKGSPQSTALPSPSNSIQSPVSSSDFLDATTSTGSAGPGPPKRDLLSLGAASLAYALSPKQHMRGSSPLSSCRPLRSLNSPMLAFSGAAELAAAGGGPLSPRRMRSQSPTKAAGGAAAGSPKLGFGSSSPKNAFGEELQSPSSRMSQIRSQVAQQLWNVGQL